MTAGPKISASFVAPGLRTPIVIDLEPQAAGLGRFRALSDAEELATAASAVIADGIATAIRQRKRASLGLAGGRTPLETYRRLARRPLRWDLVDITQTGERWVSRLSIERNANLLRSRLLIDEAARARFIPLVEPWEVDPGHLGLFHAVSHANRAVERVSPFDVLLLGMGADGHIASIFTGTPGRAELLDPTNPQHCMLAPAFPGGPSQARITLTLAAILKSRAVMLVARGAAKLERLRKALGAGGDGSPLGALLHQAERKVDVFWSP